MVYLFPKSYVRHRSPRNNQGSKLRTKKLLPFSSVLLPTPCLPSKHTIPFNTNIAIYRCKLRRAVYLATLWMTCVLVYQLRNEQHAHVATCLHDLVSGHDM